MTCFDVYIFTLKTNSQFVFEQIRFSKLIFKLFKDVVVVVEFASYSRTKKKAKKEKKLYIFFFN